MASFSAPVVLSATSVRLPPAAFAGAGSGSPAHPILGVDALRPTREDGRARLSWQDPMGQDGDRANGRDLQPQRPTRWRGDTSGIGSIYFLVQVLNQDLGPAAHPTVLHRDGAVLASDAYRRAGGDPAIYSEQPQLLRIAV